MKRIIFSSFFALYTMCANSEPAPNFFEIDNPEISSLYIKTEKDIDNLDTVTYYISKEAIDRRMIDSFFVFSDKIGKKNGAIILPLSEENDKYLKNKTKKQPDIFSLTSKSKCNFSYFKESHIIFEDRLQSRCFYFKTGEDNGWLLETLNTIYQNTNNAQSTLNTTTLEKKEMENFLSHGIKWKSDNLIDENKDQIHRFIGYLAEKISN